MTRKLAYCLDSFVYSISFKEDTWPNEEKLKCGFQFVSLVTQTECIFYTDLIYKVL